MRMMAEADRRGKCLEEECSGGKRLQLSALTHQLRYLSISTAEADHLLVVPAGVVEEYGSSSFSKSQVLDAVSRKQSRKQP
mmetsp:Transcript_740/g.1061  ORF Transcript_740/g.1061 Transcript_740/m.1061 type:complete len:81 (-) Transcript_740:115-357(-)